MSLIVCRMMASFAAAAAPPPAMWHLPDGRLSIEKGESSTEVAPIMRAALGQDVVAAEAHLRAFLERRRHALGVEPSDMQTVRIADVATYPDHSVVVSGHQ